MHLLIDALSVNNLSGRHVMLGHLQEMADSAAAGRFTVLTSAANDSAIGQLPDGVARHCAPVGASWLRRIAWQRANGPALCRNLCVDAVFSPSGMLSEGLPRPQIVLAQNPWPLVAMQRSPTDAFKSALQRRAFARAQRAASIMVFNSNYMRDLYAMRCGLRFGESIVAYQGISESLFSSGRNSGAGTVRKPMVLCVSVMARHKAIEILVDAFELVAREHSGAILRLVGAWPDSGYRGEVEARIADKGLTGRVVVDGHVDEKELHFLYAGARVFCLPSRCESFGIPAVEAQAFGTPAVVANGTAAPEVIGEGGISVAQDDPAATASALLFLLRDEESWRRISLAARANVERFHWPACSAPLVKSLARLSCAFKALRK